MGPSPKKPRLPTLHTGKRKTALETFLAKNPESSKGRETSPSPVVVVEVEDDDIARSGTSAQFEQGGEEGHLGQWTCPRCQMAFVAPDHLLEDGERTTYIVAQKQEHEDYHFARDLQDGVAPSAAPDRPTVTARGGSATFPTKKKKKPEGIKAFFMPKPTKKDSG